MFISIMSMEDYITSHTEDTIVKIEPFDESFASEGSTNAQCVLFSDEKPYKCDQCDKIFNSLSALELHFTEDHDERKVLFTSDTSDPLTLCSSLNAESPEPNEVKPWICDECDRIFDSLGAFELHVTEHEQDVFTNCEMKFNVNSEHQIQSDQIHTEERTCIKSETESSNIPDTDLEVESCRQSYICIWCKKSFYNVRLFKKHNLTKSVTCGNCNMSFGCEGLLQAHVNSRCSIESNINAHNDKPIECDGCNITFNNLHSYKLHKCTETSKSITSSKLLYTGKKFQNHKRVYTCNTCSKSFASNQNLQSHIHTQHIEKRLYPCETCSKSFRLRISLERHICANTDVKEKESVLANKSFVESIPLNHLQHYSGEQQSCQICNKSFKRKLSLQYHIRYHHEGEKPYTCKTCGKSFYKKLSFLRHVFSHKGEKPHSCEICSKCFGDKQSLKDHNRTQHASEKPHACEICGKSFAVKEYLLSHVRSHTVEKSQDAEISSKSSGHKQSLQNFINSENTTKEIYTCEICDKSFSRKKYLEHYIFAHKGKDRYICEICRKSFVNRQYLVNHINKAHAGIKPNVGEICSKSFEDKASSLNNVLTQTSKQRHKCELCSKSFSNKSYLQIHTRTHTGEKPYTCEICNKSFRVKTSFQRHIRIQHMDKKPHKCEICGKSFGDKSCLLKHLFTHTSEKPHKCQLCNKTFRDKCNLQYHIRTHSGEKPHTCEICSKTFRHKHHLLRHTDSLHGRAK